MATRYAGGCCGAEKYAVCSDLSCYRRIPESEDRCEMHGGKTLPGSVGTI